VNANSALPTHALAVRWDLCAPLYRHQQREHTHDLCDSSAHIHRVPYIPSLLALCHFGSFGEAPPYPRAPHPLGSLSEDWDGAGIQTTDLMVIAPPRALHDSTRHAQRRSSCIVAFGLMNALDWWGAGQHCLAIITMQCASSHSTPL
jgi:hypothetical protein